MHELSLLQSMVRELGVVVDQYGATKVVRFRLEIGELANVVPELLEEAFEVLRDRIPWLEGAVMETRYLPVEIRCTGCGYVGVWENRTIRCPRCDSPQVEILSGEELRLRDVELELPEDGP